MGRASAADMIFFDRSKGEKDGSPPDWFESEDVQEALALIEAYLSLDDPRRTQTQIPAVWKSYRMSNSAWLALTDTTGKACAFCERKNRTLIPYRFRPPAYAEPSSRYLEKDSYLWLAFEWNNFYPICDSCRDASAKTYFPVDGDRAHVKLRGFNPTGGIGRIRAARNDMKAEIRDALQAESNILLEPGEAPQAFRIDYNGKLHPNVSGSSTEDEFLADRVRKTINRFGLNRTEKIEDRQIVLRRRMDRLLFHWGSDWHENTETGLFEFFELEFGGAWYLMLRAFGEEMLSRIDESSSLLPDDIKSTFDMLSEKAGVSVLSECIEDAKLGTIVGGQPVQTGTGLQADDGQPDSVVMPSNFAAKQELRTRARIEKVSIRNFKSLENIEIDLSTAGKGMGGTRQRPTGRHQSELLRQDPEVKRGKEAFSMPALVLLGENSTGKSSILEGIVCALADEKALEEMLPNPAGMILNPTYLGAQNGFQPPSGSDFDRGEVSVTLGDGAQCIFTVEKRDDGAVTTRKFLNKNGDVVERSDLNLPPVFAYGAYRQFAMRDKSKELKYGIETLFRGHTYLENPEDWLSGLGSEQSDEDADEVKAREHPRLFNAVSILREIISIEGHFESIDLEEVPESSQTENGAGGSRKATCVIKIKRSKPVNGTQPAQDYEVSLPFEVASSGYRVLLALVCDIIKRLEKLNVDRDNGKAHPNVEDIRNTSFIALIDEVEVHLHPRWKMHVVQALRKQFPNAMFVMTTHDPLVLRSTLKEEVRVLRRLAKTDSDSGGDLSEFVECTGAENTPDLMTVEQLLTSDLFSLFTTDDWEMEYKLARYATLSSSDRAIADDYIREEIREHIPFGNNELVRIIHEALVEYLKDRNSNRSRSVRNEAKRRIVKALGEAGF